MRPELYDTHCHLDFPDFKEGVGEVVRRAEAAGITRLITIGTDLASSRRATDLAAVHEGVWAAVGWHPSDVFEAPEDVRPLLRKLAAAPKVAAIGEIGIDHYRLPSQRGGSAADDERHKARQVEVFRQQLEMAAELGLNCVIHQRAAFEAALAVFTPFADRVKSVFHCFVDDAEAVRRIVDLGSFVSFTGILTFKNATTVREALRAAPADRYLLETDAPFLAPVPHRGKRCEPAYVRDMAPVAAEVRGISLEQLSEETCANARAFFRGLA
ncbi:MAG: TatD family hydrolase [Verrucomicrobiae bacterium]|nr:TatD family hydrolase [Verrucomicrobiae bacterium]